MRLLLFFILLLPIKAFSLTTVLDTGDIIEPGNYELGAQSQFITEKPENGVNFIGHVYLPIDKSWNIKFHAGTGTHDFNLGGGLKWIPIPDINQQPAMGLIMELEWASDNYGSSETFDMLFGRVSPLISKSFLWEFGNMEPYASVPMGIRYFLDNVDHVKRSEFFMQLALGVKLEFQALENFSVYGEGGFDLKDSFTYFSLMGRFRI